MKKQINEIKRMQKLAGVIKESQQLNEDIHDDIDQDLMNGDLDQEGQIEYLRDIINYCQSKINEIESNLNESQLNENEGQEINLYDIINSNKNELAEKFNLDMESLVIGANDEDEPVVMIDDNNEIDFIKKTDWESNKGFYKRHQGIGEITLNGIDIIYVVNSY
jgi:hypothetical protein